MIKITQEKHVRQIYFNYCEFGYLLFDGFSETHRTTDVYLTNPKLDELFF